MEYWSNGLQESLPIKDKHLTHHSSTPSLHCSSTPVLHLNGLLKQRLFGPQQLLAQADVINMRVLKTFMFRSQPL
jgi:hypothetical protein